MRTTINIDDDVLAAARQLASTEQLTLGEAVSALARQGMQKTESTEFRNGIKLLPATGNRVTMAEVNTLRDELR